MGIVISPLIFLFNHSMLPRHIPAVSRHVLNRICWYKIYTGGSVLTDVPPQQQQWDHYLECIVFTLLNTVLADFLVELLILLTSIKTCTCGLWQEHKVPCVDACVCIAYRIREERNIQHIKTMK